MVKKIAEYLEFIAYLTLIVVMVGIFPAILVGLILGIFGML